MRADQTDFRLCRLASRRLFIPARWYHSCFTSFVCCEMEPATRPIWFLGYSITSSGCPYPRLDGNRVSKQHRSYPSRNSTCAANISISIRYLGLRCLRYSVYAGLFRGFTRHWHTSQPSGTKRRAYHVGFILFTPFTRSIKEFPSRRVTNPHFFGSSSSFFRFWCLFVLDLPLSKTESHISLWERRGLKSFYFTFGPVEKEALWLK